MSAITKSSKKMMNRKSRGQGMTEYIIIVALIAIAAIGVITLFGNNIRQIFATSSDALAGDTDAKNDSKNADKTKLNKTMKDFGQKNEAP